jgi:hypothetical protein
MSEGGFYLYLGRQSYPSWMSYKCHTSKKITFRVLAQVRVLAWMDEVEMSWSELARL